MSEAQSESEAEYLRRRARQERRNSRKVVTPRWMQEGQPLEVLLRAWAIDAMMRQREIELKDIAAELGISRERVSHLLAGGNFVAGSFAPLVDIERVHQGHDRIEAAITAISDRQGGVYKAVGDDDLTAAKKAAGMARLLSTYVEEFADEEEGVA